MKNLGASRVLFRLGPANILIVAAIVRVIWIAACPNEPVSDQTIYHSSAAFLAEGKGYVDESGKPANYWPVGYSAFLAPFYFVLGSHPSSAFVANFILGLLTVWGVYMLGRELFGENTGRVAGAITAIYPTFVFYTTCIASENAYVPGMLWTIWFGLRAAQAHRSTTTTIA
jgi:4-amino-4-deoxy-L-arabinose transferase-like glycosyltransferase